MAIGEDYRKYFCALGSRSVRRVAAKVYAAAELDAEMRIAMMKQLTQMVTWQQTAAIAGWPLDDHTTDGTDGEEGAIEIDWAVYSDGRPVFTVVDWLDGYATIVHHPDLLQPETEDTRQLGPSGRSVTTTVQVRTGPSEWGIESRTNTTASVVVGDPPTHRRLPRPDRGDRYRGL